MDLSVLCDQLSSHLRGLQMGREPSSLEGQEVLLGKAGILGPVCLVEGRNSGGKLHLDRSLREGGGGGGWGGRSGVGGGERGGRGGVGTRRGDGWGRGCESGGGDGELYRGPGRWGSGCELGCGFEEG